MEIRLATVVDAEEILAIYAPYVRNTAMPDDVMVKLIYLEDTGR